MVAGKRLSVRFTEPEQQGTFRPAFASRSSQSDADQSSWQQRAPSSSNPNGNDAPGTQKPPDVPPSPNQTRTNGATRDPRPEEADDAARLAKLAQEAAEREERIAQDALTSATREYSDARGAQASADAAVEEAERVLLAAKERQLQAVHRVIQGLEKKNKAAERERDAGRRRRAAVLDAQEKKARAEEVRRDTPSSPTAGPWGSGSRGTGEDSAREKGGEPEWRANARRRQASTKENMSPLEETFGNRGHWGWGFQQNGTDWRDNAWHRSKGKSEERSSNGHQQTSTNVDSEGSDEQRKAGQDGEESRREDEFREEEEENMREEVGRRTRLEESIKKMKLMREQEELDRHERQRKVEQEELLKRKEAERTAREAREKQAQEEKERLAQEAQRRKTYDEAVGRETFRCQIRDRTLWNILPTPSASLLWTDKLSISRFQGVSTEFDTIKFCDSQPVTSASIPWPVLQYPPLVKVEDIDWSAVEQFFAAAKRDLIATEYKAMVEKAHRRFHPDKWRSRGLLITVVDEELRKRLENAGNIVAQAITPLWLASKSR
ncbi:hypothetical protein PHLGIDRAFT_214043 [Phlebiopsis gigantea 11061_1 CR5-6]|uniref:Uncharacterized protein n=1 Tax=Phlebiopsis gigantea (strain 11061_1 CR5-6) TaxID=745531 RepID=A0A0C3NGU1_PHLG1|nr:hypothetical protein PHLGIDRAFT_214043 [Phlebiopsis gigantea 11061_1 CR5-6]